MGEAEMDWGDLMIFSMDENQVKKCFVRSKYSGKPFVRLYRNERQQMFFDSHIRAFAYYGNIFPTIIYYNLTTVVKQVLREVGVLNSVTSNISEAIIHFSQSFAMWHEAMKKAG